MRSCTFKTVNDAYIEPISLIVPRRAEVFQDDIYPTFGSKPAVSGAEYFEGKDGLPPKIDLASVYPGGEPAEVPSECKPLVQDPASKAPQPARKESEPVKESAQPSSASRSPPPSMKEQTNSIANLAANFTDKDEDEKESHDDDTSSFEEVSKPIERNAHPASKPIDKTKSAAIAKGLSTGQTSPTKSQHTPTLPPQSASTASTTPALRSPPATTTSSSSSEPLQSYLQDIKSLLERQNATMTAQSKKIAPLTREVDTLKMAVGSRGGNSNKDARIRALKKKVKGLRNAGD